MSSRVEEPRGDLDTRQRTDLVPALLASARMCGNFVGPRLGSSWSLLVGRIIDAVEDRQPSAAWARSPPSVEVEARRRATMPSSTARTRRSGCRTRFGAMQARHHVDRAERPFDHLIDVRHISLAFGRGQRLVHAARNGAGAVDAFSTRCGRSSWPELPEEHAPCLAISGKSWATPTMLPGQLAAIRKPSSRSN